MTVSCTCCLCLIAQRRAAPLAILIHVHHSTLHRWRPYQNAFVVAVVAVVYTAMCPTSLWLSHGSCKPSCCPCRSHLVTSNPKRLSTRVSTIPAAHGTRASCSDTAMRMRMRAGLPRPRAALCCSGTFHSSSV